MKTKVSMISAALLALVMCGGTLLSYAQDAQPATGTTTQTWHGHRHGHNGYWAQELNLTDAQKEQIRSIRQANRQNLLPLREQMAANRKAMLAATSNGAYDQAKVQALAGQQAQLMAQMMVQREAIQHQIYTQVLTPEQRVKADQLRAQQMSRIDKHMQRMSELGAAAPQQP